MMRFLPFILAWLLLSLLPPSLATAEAPASEAQELAALRHSGSYEEGLKKVREKIDFPYDLGAVHGASHWELIHGYYTEVATAKGCKTGAQYADGPVKTCHVVSKPAPPLVGTSYEKGRSEIVAAALERTDPELVRKVLFVIYDYGYVQGMKHGLRKHDDDLGWAQSFYRSCVARANDAEHEPICANSSKAWSATQLTRLRNQIESHGLPVGMKPK